MDYLLLLLDPQFVITVLVAVAAFSTIMTLAMPYFVSDRLNARLKAVATQREELRRRQREALSRKGQLRSTPVGFMKQTVDQLKLENILQSPNTKEKLSQAGYRGQGPLLTFMFFRFVMPFIVFFAALIYLF